MKKRQKIKNRPEPSPEGLVRVDSKAYGEHFRAARGKHTEAVLNETFKKNTVALPSLSIDAKLIKGELEQYFWDPKPSQFWQRLLSKLWAAYKAGPVIDTSPFVNWDIYEEYKFKRLVAPACSVEEEADALTLNLSWKEVPNFKRKFADGYQYGLIYLAVDRATNTARSEIQFSDVFPLDLKKSSCDFSFQCLEKTGYVLLFLVLNATAGGQLKRAASTSGFKCVWAARIEEEGKG